MILREGVLVSVCAICAVIFTGHEVQGQKVEAEEFRLPNGMQFLLVPRADQPNVVSAGWVARPSEGLVRNGSER